jgi:hypothetical protein
MQFRTCLNLPSVFCIRTNIRLSITARTFTKPASLSSKAQKKKRKRIFSPFYSKFIVSFYISSLGFIFQSYTKLLLRAFCKSRAFQVAFKSNCFFNERPPPLPPTSTPCFVTLSPPSRDTSLCLRVLHCFGPDGEI